MEEMPEEHASERDELKLERTAMKITVMVLDAGATKKAMQSKGALHEHTNCWSSL